MNSEKETKAEVNEVQEMEDIIAAEEIGTAEAGENAPDKESAESEFISEFAPAPIKIPYYNKEKERKKVEKKKAKNKKRKYNKTKKSNIMLRKVAVTARAIVMFILLLAVTVLTLSSVIVRMNTSEYAIEKAITGSDPERYIVGKIKAPEKLNLKKSADHASVADIIRDNSMITVTYSDIEQAVKSSSYPKFVAGVANNVIRYYLYDDTYVGLTAKDLADVMLENASYIKVVTGTELGESACNDFGKYMAKSTAFKELNENLLNAQKAAEYTPVTSVLFSTIVLVCMIIALMLLLVLTVMACKGYAHKIIGWAIAISGLFAGIAGYLFKPLFKASSDFIACVVEAITNNFNQSALVAGGIALLVGVLVVLIGQAMHDDDEEEDDEIDEDDYIDEIEQVSTAQ